MNHSLSEFMRTLGTVPRTRGDEPILLMAALVTGARSPHARG